VREGRFREPLLNRLAGYQVDLPTLRERRDDIGRLVAHRLTEELKLLGEPERLADLVRAEPWLPAPLVDTLARYDWPGNVRELCNVVRRLVIAGRGGRRVSEADLPPRIQRATIARTRVVVAMPPGAANVRRPPAEITDEELLGALRENGWSTSDAARQLGISRTSLYALIDRSPTIRKAKDVSADELARVREECGDDPDVLAARLEVSPRGLRLRLKELGVRY
jgi:two-component system nitrogen regulation response regulator GlnG